MRRDFYPETFIEITEEIVGRLGLSAAELEAWTELSLASLIVTVTCPG